MNVVQSYFRMNSFLGSSLCEQGFSMNCEDSSCLLLGEFSSGIIHTYLVPPVSEKGLMVL